MQRQNLATEILEAGSTIGFFFVKDYPKTGLGINFLKQAAEYFAQPDENKLKDITPFKNGFTRGYLSIGSESGSPDLFERKEAFSYGYDGFTAPNQTGSPANSLEGQNTWPQVNSENFNASKFRQECVNFYNDNMTENLTLVLALLIFGVLKSNNGTARYAHTGESH